ncbi:UNKNOWN [Stylonychia lemnae]|uniref:Uncharacterized protein n=1 Tax=Stylonychia lemnae TaxID=5949 RepID=A0A078AXZ1_STYLE|nr:UNKNOWN [Stylonychia lemnae]|eukprot:CDW87039.1 UNKNOWN [Stylonychia lemnae]
MLTNKYYTQLLNSNDYQRSCAENNTADEVTTEFKQFTAVYQYTSFTNNLMEGNLKFISNGTLKMKDMSIETYYITYGRFCVPKVSIIAKQPSVIHYVQQGPFKLDLNQYISGDEICEDKSRSFSKGGYFGLSPFSIFNYTAIVLQPNQMNSIIKEPLVVSVQYPDLQQLQFIVNVDLKNCYQWQYVTKFLYYKIGADALVIDLLGRDDNDIGPLVRAPNSTTKFYLQSNDPKDVTQFIFDCYLVNNDPYRKIEEEIVSIQLFVMSSCNSTQVSFNQTINYFAYTLGQGDRVIDFIKLYNFSNQCNFGYQFVVKYNDYSPVIPSFIKFDNQTLKFTINTEDEKDIMLHYLRMRVTYLSGSQFVLDDDLYWYLVVQGKNGTVTDYSGPYKQYFPPDFFDQFEPKNITVNNTNTNISNNNNNTNGYKPPPKQKDIIEAFFFGIKPPKFIQELKSTIICYSNQITDYELPQISSTYNQQPSIYIQNVRQFAKLIQ